MQKKFTDKCVEISFGRRSVLFNPFTLQFMLSEQDKNGFSQQDVQGIATSEFHFEMPRIRKYRVETTLDCNCACDYCLVYNNQIPQIGCSMNLKTAKNIAERFNKETFGEGSLMLIGGEPLLNRPVLDYFIENVQGNITLFSNAMLVDENLAKRLARKNIQVFVSLDGWEDLNIHRKDLYGAPSYRRTLKGYKLLRHAGVKTAINCLATTDNVSYLHDVVKYFFENYGERSFGISIPHYTKHGNLDVDVKRYTDEMLEIFDYAKENSIYVDQIAKRLSALTSGKPRYYSCKIIGEQRTFYPDGRETLCTKMDTLEDLKDRSIAEYEKLLPFNSGDCLECMAIGICGGGCFWDALHSESRRDRRDCYFNEAILNKMLGDISRSYSGRVPVPRDLIAIYSGMLQKSL